MQTRLLLTKVRNVLMSYPVIIKSYYDYLTDLTYNCLWLDCMHTANNTDALQKHLCYHGYHTKLKNIGSNVLERIKLPKCTQMAHFIIPETVDGYTCEWNDCYKSFSLYFDFLEHIKIHINSNPKYCKKGEIIECYWTGMFLNLALGQIIICKFLFLNFRM